jgi:hypothetical protein
LRTVRLNHLPADGRGQRTPARGKRIRTGAAKSGSSWSEDHAGG